MWLWYRVDLIVAYYRHEDIYCSVMCYRVPIGNGCHHVHPHAIFIDVLSPNLAGCFFSQHHVPTHNL